MNKGIYDANSRRETRNPDSYNNGHVCTKMLQISDQIFHYNSLPTLKAIYMKWCNTRVVPKVMSNFFLHANWEQ